MAMFFAICILDELYQCAEVGKTYFQFFEIKLANLKNIPYIYTLIVKRTEGTVPIVIKKSV